MLRKNCPFCYNFPPRVPTESGLEEGGGDRGRPGVLDIMHCRSRMTIDPRIPTMSGRSTSGFYPPGRQTLLAPSEKRREM